MINDFVQLLLAFSQVQSDVIGNLPTEVAANIFRYIDDESLVSAAGVNHRWKNVCKGDPILRRRIRKRLQIERKARFIQAYNNTARGVQVTQTNPAAMFGRKNGTVTVSARINPVEYEAPVKTTAPQMKKFHIKKTQNIVKVKKSLKRTCIDVNNNVTIKKKLRL